MPDVRFGSKADIGLASVDVRFAPKSGHRSARSQCPFAPATDTFTSNRLLRPLIRKESYHSPRPDRFPEIWLALRLLPPHDFFPISSSRCRSEFISAAVSLMRVSRLEHHP